MRTHRVFQKWPQPLSRGIQILWFARVARRRTRLRIPPRPCSWHTSPFGNVQQHAMAWRKRKYSLHQAYGFRCASEEQVRSKGVLRNLLRHHSTRQQSAHLRCKRKSFRCLSVIEGFDAQWIARQEKQRCRRKSSTQIKQRKRKHAAELSQTFLAPLFPRMHQNFRVGLCSEAVSQ